MSAVVWKSGVESGFLSVLPNMILAFANSICMLLFKSFVSKIKLLMSCYLQCLLQRYDFFCICINSVYRHDSTVFASGTKHVNVLNFWGEYF